MSVEITLGHLAIPPDETWKILRASHPLVLHHAAQVDFYGDQYAAEDMVDAIRTKGKAHFLAKFHDGVLSYSRIANAMLDQIFIEGCVGGIDDAWAWIEPLSELKVFRAARIFDREYEYWQKEKFGVRVKPEVRGQAGSERLDGRIRGLYPSIISAVARSAHG